MKTDQTKIPHIVKERMKIVIQNSQKYQEQVEIETPTELKLWAEQVAQINISKLNKTEK
jgi:energy-converting hydrogenase A subunit M